MHAHCVCMSMIQLSSLFDVCYTEKVSFWGERRDYWSYLNEGVGGMRTLGSITKQVQALPQVR